jgi:hypothetical protein
MRTSSALSNVRAIAFGAAGTVCAIYAFATLLVADPGQLPHWAPLIAGCLAALTLFAASFAAGPRIISASFDEGYQNDRRSAAVAGFWSALSIGTTLWLGNIGGESQLAITLTGASAVFLLTHVFLEIKGRR